MADEMVQLPGGGFAHETARVDAGASVGEGTKVWHFSHIQAGARIGRGCNIGQNAFVGSGAAIGDGCKVQNNVSVYPGVTVEDDCFLGPSCVFTNDLTPRADFPKGPAGWKGTIVRRGASIGANATVVCGHEVGERAFVAAGAVVASDVPAHALVAGVPARRVGWVCDCGSVLGPIGGGRLLCPACGRVFEERPDGSVSADDGGGSFCAEGALR
ncbi:acyltransferase [Collinsella ihumii]|uniref:Acyltransferase n=1 Tax=Collinsella ihumii TaxID=1720204 RepID=A0AAW7JS05_9ACTN|nr:acyltransferase [Collinsella ihumii]MDN0069549.1 acyltransferase [Collinsella ihumii]